MKTLHILGLLIAAIFVAAPAQAESVPASREQITLSFAPVAKQALPAVVNIYAQKIVRRRERTGLFADEFLKRFFGGDTPFSFGQTRERVENSLGSGVIVQSDGIVVTNHHVIADATEIKVVLADRREFAATLMLTDERTDIAVLRIDAEGVEFPVLPYGNSEGLEVGDLVLAIGNPFGVGQTVTSGIVSGLARTSVGIADFRSFIQTDAAINPGNSGGALVGMDGSLVGINTAIFSTNERGGSLGIGFAVPINMVKRVVKAAVTGQELIRPWLGFSGRDVSAEIAEALGLATPSGVLVQDVHSDGPAASAGLVSGDVVVAVDGKPVEDGQALRFYFATREIGGEVPVAVIRDDTIHTLRFALLAPPEEPPRDRTDIVGDFPISGIRVINLSPLVAEEIGLPTDLTGVMVEAVQRGSVAARAGIRPLDIIREVNGLTITVVDNLVQIVDDPPPEWLVVLDRKGRKLVLEAR
ncbi:MAG: Do family serine endopeptidase [Alphaproteobacteria bacterium]